ncbi:MAG: hypothetical protein ACM34I_01000 [bacterium]
MRLRTSFFLFAVLSLALMAPGCMPRASYRAHPSLDASLKTVKTVGLIAPDIKIYELSAGDVEELRDDWCKQGRDNVTKAVIDEFRSKKIAIKTKALDKDSAQDLPDIQALYRAVSYSILSYTYGDFKFPEKYKNFDYSIGPIRKITDAYGVDALIFVYGYDEISSGGRKALRALSMVTGVITGYQRRAGLTAMSMALVDKSGSILWYDIDAAEGGYDLRQPDSSAKFVRALVADFPEVSR